MKSLLILLVMMVLAGCNLVTSPAAPSGEATPTRSEPSNPATDLTQTHIDMALGIAFDYPVGWFIESRPGELIQLYSGYGEARPGDSQGFPPDETKIEFLVGSERDAYQTIEDYLNFHRQSEHQNGPGGRMISEELVTLPSGFPAARVSFTGGMAGDAIILSMVVEVRGRLVHVTCYGDSSRFEEIMATLRKA